MKKVFYFGLAGLVVFEVGKVFFIMPFPGSQQGGTLELAYALHGFRWVFRIALGLAIVAGAMAAFRGRSRSFAVPALLLAGAAVWMLNFRMSADAMFREPATLAFAGAASSAVPADALVLGIEVAGEAKAYPIRYLAYHHQVRDTVGGAPVLVTYCSVCRSGRAFDPTVRGEPATFRLVGMDTFNAMFEDAATGTWWRQASGRAVAGPLTGDSLKVVEARQMSAGEWFRTYPQGVVMQPDPAAIGSYDTEGRYERGEGRGSLTGTSRESWAEKSWVVGVERGRASKAYDWNRLGREGVINDELDGAPIAVVLQPGGQGFVAVERPSAAPLRLEEGSLRDAEGGRYDWSGTDPADPSRSLRRLPAYQEFWHSWRSFHPDTARG